MIGKRKAGGCFHISFSMVIGINQFETKYIDNLITPLGNFLMDGNSNFLCAYKSREDDVFRISLALWFFKKIGPKQITTFEGFEESSNFAHA